MIERSPFSCDQYFSSLEKVFSISTNDIRAMITDFHAEMEKGLCGQESSLKMIPSFVDKPKGNEKGEFLALDLGGTRLRVLAVKLDGKGNATVSAAKRFIIPKHVMGGAGVALFDFIAVGIDEFFIENQYDRNKSHNLAFTFSFPVEQTGISAGRLIEWTKGFTARGVRGRDVIVLLNEALERKHIHCINVTALANDTVGTLAARSYGDPACDVGVIMGTGTNGCYRESLSRIEKYSAPFGKGHMIVNMEWGNFDKARRNGYDEQLDEASVNPGAMYLEKMVSGMYLGELTRLMLLDLMEKGLILVNETRAARCFYERGSLKTEDMSRIEGDKTEGLDSVVQFFKRKDISNVALHDRIQLKCLCRIVSTRAARLGAGAISAVLAWIDPTLEGVHTVAIDGSLFEKYPGLKARMREVFKEIHGEKAERIKLVHSRDGSGKGAAIIAAVAALSEKAEA